MLQFWKYMCFWVKKAYYRKWTFVSVFCDLENDITTVTSVFLWIYGHVHKWHPIVSQSKRLETWHDFIGGTLGLHLSKFTGKCPLIPPVQTFMLFYNAIWWLYKGALTSPVETKAFYLQARCNTCSAFVKCLLYLLACLQLLVERITAESKNGGKAWISCFLQKIHAVNTPLTTVLYLCYLYVRAHYWTKYMR